MSVKLKKLYDDIYSVHDVHLLTESCFNKRIVWVHMVENYDFIPLLQGDELVFNSSLDGETDERRKEFIDKLISHDAGGLIVALQPGKSLQPSLVEYCNSIEFPLFLASWETSYLNIMRRFSEILLSNERNEMNLSSALKNAIYFPDKPDSYLRHFERNNYTTEMPYVISVINNDSPEEFQKLDYLLQHHFSQIVYYLEPNRIVIMTVGYSPKHLEKKFQLLIQKCPSSVIGIGSLEYTLSELCCSYEHAVITLKLAQRVFSNKTLCYDDIGAYQLICDAKSADKLHPAFVKKVLGKLIKYDVENKTSYMTVLKDYFRNDCCIAKTAEETFFHANTLKYKVKHIKEILGYDITANVHRTNIMLALYMLSIVDSE